MIYNKRKSKELFEKHFIHLYFILVYKHILVLTIVT